MLHDWAIVWKYRSIHCCAGNLFHLQWPIHMIARPIEIQNGPLNFFWRGHGPILIKTFKITEDGCHIWNRNCLHFGSTWIHRWFLVGFVLLNLRYCWSLFVLCIVCPFFDLRLLIIPLVSSNFSQTKLTQLNLRSWVL